MLGAIRNRSNACLAAAFAMLVARGTALAQEPPPPGSAAPAPSGRAVVGAPIDGLQVLPADVQVVRFQGPPGLVVDVLEPSPTPVTVTAEGLIEGVTHGLQVGVPYRLQLSNLPNAPDAVLYPVIEVVGHLHRPPNVDPSKYPIRVEFAIEDLEEVIANGRLITRVIYLESPDQAIPIRLPKAEVPVVSIGGAEDPLKVAKALGRVMAIVTLGGRQPLPGEPPSIAGLISEAGPCPLFGLDALPGGCQIPVCADLTDSLCPPDKPVLARDEYLCDGGDHGQPAAFATDGGLSGVDPKDAVVEFRAEGRQRLLPTNVVCIFAPRFAAVRQSVGPIQTQLVQIPVGTELVERQVTSATRQPPMKLTLNQPAEVARMRERASGLINRYGPSGHIEVRVLSGILGIQSVDDRDLLQQAGSTQLDLLPNQARLGNGPVVVREAEGTLISGLVESTGEKVMGWKPQELAGVEVPPHKPALAVLKQVDVDQAEPGDRVRYTIRYKNVGGVPIAEVSIVDSLLPRLEYVPGTSQGPPGTVFTAAENRVGSVELRWDLPEPLAPGAEGLVTFEAIVR